jgi:hypothetical protein
LKQSGWLERRLAKSRSSSMSFPAPSRAAPTSARTALFAAGVMKFASDSFASCSAHTARCAT